MWVNWTDITLVLHAVLLVVLGFMILRAANGEHDRGFWRMWPPTLLFLWGAAEIADGLIYGRRWLARQTDLGVVKYESIASFALNLVSMALIALLIWRIWRGDMDGEEIEKGGK